MYLSADRLAEFAHLLTTHGPSSLESEAFLAENSADKAFVEVAQMANFTLSLMDAELRAAGRPVPRVAAIK